jgi:hypothetical protein
MKIFSALILLTIVFISCEKEISTEPPAPPGNGNNNPPANDSTLLLKYIEVDTTLPAGSDTIFQDIYSYDNKRRLIHYYANVFSTEQEADLFYSGNDTLPYKVISVWTNSSDIYHDTVFYFYSNGLVTKDSTIEYNGATNQFSQAIARVYTPEGDNAQFEYRHYSLPHAPPDEEKRLTFLITRQNGNIRVQDDTSAVVQFSYAAHEEVKYDDKTNPFYQAFPMHYQVLSGSFSGQKNNPVEDITWDDPSQPTRLTYSYTYRADGRPLLVKVFDQALGGEYVKGIFLYTK